MLVPAILTQAVEGGFTALNPDTGTVSEDETVAAAIDNLREAVELYLTEFPLRSVGAPLVTTLLVGDRA